MADGVAIAIAMATSKSGARQVTDRKAFGNLLNSMATKESAQSLAEKQRTASCVCTTKAASCTGQRRNSQAA